MMQEEGKNALPSPSLTVQSGVQFCISHCLYSDLYWQSPIGAFKISQFITRSIWPLED